MGSEFGKGQVEGVMGRITQSLTDIADAFEAAVGPISKFVDAISPGTMQLFQMALRDLHATIGSALLPVVNVMTDAVKKASQMLVPAVDALAPAFRSLANALTSFMMPAIQVTSHALKSMAPLLESVGDVLKTMGDVLGVMSVLLLSIKDALGQFFKSLIGGTGGGFSDMLAKLRDGVYQLMTTLLVAAAYIAKAFGALGFIEHLQKNLRELAKPGDEGGKGAALQGASLKGFEQISKDLAVAAAQAVAGGGDDVDKKLEEWAADAVGKLDEVMKNGQTLTQVLENLWQKLSEKVDTKVDEIIKTIKEKLTIF